MFAGRHSITTRLLILLAVMALVVSTLPPSVAAGPESAIPAGRTRSATPFGRTPQPVPEEVRAFFEGGVTVQEFVERTGYVPRALMDVADQPVTMIVELEQPPISVVQADRRARGAVLAQSEAQAYGRALAAAQDAVMQAASALGAQELVRFSAAYNGIMVRIPANRVAELAALRGVKAVHRAPVHEPALGASVPLIGASGVWQDLGVDGEGVVIAIIDTGIDYTHAAFGGSGDPADYAENDPNIVEQDTFPTPKVIAGWDFVGTLYRADCTPAGEAAGTCSPNPSPDPDPLDENGHGTHVASIAAGIAAGAVMTGTAPSAQLVALKVFGRAGSTEYVMAALEWATQMYLAEGWPHVINMSLGSIFGTDDPNDPSVAASNNAVEAGMVVVVSAGNSGDHSYITGSPGTASKVLSVAATTTGWVTGPTVSISGTAHITQTDIIYYPSAFDNDSGRIQATITAPLAYVGALPGATDNLLCSVTGITPGALAGQIALISRGTCAFSVKVNNAAALGAVAALIYNNQPGSITMAGPPVQIPAASLLMPDGLNLIPAHGQVAIISGEDEVITKPDPTTSADRIATFSSRGPRGYDSALKPEVSAPGVGIFAANMGSGVGGVAMGGTSMAAPHVAGVAALLRQANPDWTPEQIKAAIINTAVPLVDATAIPRAGNGRVDAYAAVTTPVVAIGNEDLVSLSWGLVTSNQDTLVLTDTITLYNQGEEPAEFLTDIQLHPLSTSAGITSLDVAPGWIEVPAGGSAQVTVTIELAMASVAMNYYDLEEYFGQVVFSGVASIRSGVEPANGMGPALTVPFYFTPKPYTSLEIEADRAVLHPLADMATITLTHSGPVASELWVLPALYVATAPKPDVASLANVRMFGMDYGWTDPTMGDYIMVAINTFGPWHTPQIFFAEFDLYMDVNNDGQWDYMSFNHNLGWWYGTGHNNQWIVVQYDLASGLLYLGSNYLIETDFNNSFMAWYLPAVWYDLGPTNSTFGYRLVVWDPYGMPDATPPGRFDYANWPYLWGPYSNPHPDDPMAIYYVWMNDVDAYDLIKPVGLMFLDYHGDPHNVDGAQAYWVPMRLFRYAQIFPLTFGGRR